MSGVDGAEAGASGAHVRRPWRLGAIQQRPGAGASVAAHAPSVRDRRDQKQPEPAVVAGGSAADSAAPIPRPGVADLDLHEVGVELQVERDRAVRGGVAVAPPGFGRFAGRLIAPDELSGRIMAVDARGRAVVLARSDLPAGGDLGVESLGFAPRGFERGTTALLADRAVPGAPHPGTDTILGVSGAALHRAGVRAGDLLAAAEGGGETIAIRCPRRGPCTVRLVAHGPAVTHAEGHIVFTRTR